MTQLAEVQARLGNMRVLLDIVGAMRSLAGMRMQEAQHALPGVRRYAEIIADAIADTLPRLPEPERAGRSGGRRALVACTAEHGFVGGFNERLIEEVERVHRAGDMLFVLGTRGGAMLFERGRSPAWSHPMATRSRAAIDVVQELSTELYRQIARGNIVRVDVMYLRMLQDAAAAIQWRAILPFDVGALGRRAARQAPLHNLQPAALQEKLVAEYIFARLTEAAVESIASENAARFAAMEAAHDNVEKKLNGLRQEAREARQAEITTEILELVTADAALAEAR